MQSRIIRDSSSVGRAARCQRAGRRFKPCLSLNVYCRKKNVDAPLLVAESRKAENHNTRKRSKCSNRLVGMASHFQCEIGRVRDPLTAPSLVGATQPLLATMGLDVDI